MYIYRKILSSVICALIFCSTSSGNRVWKEYGMGPDAEGRFMDINFVPPERCRGTPLYTDLVMEGRDLPNACFLSASDDEEATPKYWDFEIVLRDFPNWEEMSERIRRVVWDPTFESTSVVHGASSSNHYSISTQLLGKDGRVPTEDDVRDFVWKVNEKMRERAGAAKAARSRFGRSLFVPIEEVLHSRGPQRGFVLDEGPMEDLQPSTILNLKDGTQRVVVEVNGNQVYFEGDPISVGEDKVEIRKSRAFDRSAAAIRWTDGGWVNGYARGERPIFFILNTELGKKWYAPGTLLELPNGEQRRVEAVTDEGPFLHIHLEGERLDGETMPVAPIGILEHAPGTSVPKWGEDQYPPTDFGPVQWTDGDWIDGHHRTQPKFMVYATPEVEKYYNYPGQLTLITFPSYHQRAVRKVERVGPFLHITYRGPRITLQPHHPRSYGLDWVEK